MLPYGSGSSASSEFVSAHNNSVNRFNSKSKVSMGKNNSLKRNVKNKDKKYKLVLKEILNSKLKYKQL